jgi:DNA-binding MarR family transcriptional regulator
MASRTGRSPKSAMMILGALAHDGPMCPIEISEKLNMAPRTVSFALKQLLKRQLLRRVPNLLDMRRPMYHVNMEHAKDLLQKYNDAAFRGHPSPLAWRQKS